MKIATAGLTCYLVVLLSFINLPLHGQEASQLPKGAKQEAVLYKNADMVGLGYRYKKQFVENQQVEFFKLYNAKKYKLKKEEGEYYVAGRGKMLPVTSLAPLLQGTYFTANGMAYVEGEWYPEAKNIYETIYEVYKGTFLISDTGNGIRPVDIQEFSIKTGTATLTGESQGDNTDYQLEVDFIGRNIKRLKCKFPKDVLIKKACETPKNLIVGQQIGEDMIYKCLSYIEQEGTPVSILFTNGNQFNGNIRLDSGNNVFPNKGICTYVTGETFDGIYEDIFWDSRNGQIHIPTQGIITFTDGKKKIGNWLRAYNFTEEDWASIYKEGDSPTAIRDKALRKQRDKQRELAEAKRRQELKEQRKKQEELRKKQEEQRKKQEELRKKQEQERQKIIRHQQLIAKYGQHYGPLIEKGELELGMTTAMVNEIWSQDFFDRSEAIEYGQRIEVWTFNESKMNMAIAKKEDGETELLAMLFIDRVGEMFGISGITKKDIPYQLVFTNRRLTGIIR